MVITVISPGASKMPPHDGNVAKFTYATSLTVRDTTGILAGWHLLIVQLFSARTQRHHRHLEDGLIDFSCH